MFRYCFDCSVLSGPASSLTAHPLSAWKSVLQKFEVWKKQIPSTFKWYRNCFKKLVKFFLEFQSVSHNVCLEKPDKKIDLFIKFAASKCHESFSHVSNSVELFWPDLTMNCTGIRPRTRPAFYEGRESKLKACVWKKRYRLCYYYEFVLRKMPETSFLKIRPVWWREKDGSRNNDDIFVINFEKICKSMGMAILVIFFVVSLISMAPRTIVAHEFTRDPKGK